MVILIVGIAIGMILGHALDYFEAQFGKKETDTLIRRLTLAQVAIARLGRMFPETKSETDQILKALSK